MNILAVIPARGRSKRVPKKNIRRLAGRPLLAWSVDAAKASRLVTRVVVSTEDLEIAEVAAASGAEVIMRPEEAARDDSPIEAALWSVHQNVGGDYEWMVTLQPTVPLRRPRLIDDVIERAMLLEADAVFTARSWPKCWLWEETTGNEFAEQMDWRCLGEPLQSQQVTMREALWMHDGSVCVTHHLILERQRRRMGGRAHPFSNESTIDIDTEEDFALAEAQMAVRQGLALLPQRRLA